ncbi:hypothetical protein C2S51_033472 [Perilla frutescens var. frutescens]|nr:hypothetical protein C2S51_033472 [Perilla frutescens var. frutescens]
MSNQSVRIATVRPLPKPKPPNHQEDATRPSANFDRPLTGRDSETSETVRVGWRFACLRKTDHSSEESIRTKANSLAVLCTLPTSSFIWQRCHEIYGSQAKLFRVKKLGLNYRASSSEQRISGEAQTPSTAPVSSMLTPTKNCTIYKQCTLPPPLFLCIKCL